jgi:hypothetical protein
MPGAPDSSAVQSQDASGSPDDPYLKEIEEALKKKD